VLRRTDPSRHWTGFARLDSLGLTVTGLAKTSSGETQQVRLAAPFANEEYLTVEFSWRVSKT
jgi:hypothetical protein